MSARWRRGKKHSRRFDIIRSSDRVKNKRNPLTFRINPWVESQRHPYRFGGLKTYRRGKCRELEPLIDVLEEADEIVVVAEFAGFQREDLKIHVKNQRLTLSAEAPDHRYHKSLNLPGTVIPNNIRATCKNGVLEIRLRRAVEEKTLDEVAG